MSTSIIVYPPPLVPTPFPYTTLFRSVEPADRDVERARGDRARRRAAERDHDRARVLRAVADVRRRHVLERRVRPRSTRADRKSKRLNSSHVEISYAVFCLKKKTQLML